MNRQGSTVDPMKSFVWVEAIIDRGAQFEGEIFSKLSSIIGFHHIRTCAYTPSSNRICERMHRTLKASIMACKKNWYTSLLVVLLGIRMTNSITGFPPFTAVTGTYMLCPHPIINKNTQIAHATIKQLIEEMQLIYFYNNASGMLHSTPQPYIPVDLLTCDQVWLRIDRVQKNLEAPYCGPFKVLRRHSKHFIIRLPQGDTSVSVNRSKPAKIPGNTNNDNNNSPQAPSAPPNPPAVTPPTVPVTPTPPNPKPPPPPNDDSDVVFPPAATNTQSPVKTRSGRQVRFDTHNDYRYFQLLIQCSSATCGEVI